MRLVLRASLAACLPALGLLGATAAYLWIAYGYSAQAREIPVDVGWTVVALLFLDLLSRTRTRAGVAVTRWLNPAALATSTDAAPQPWARQFAAVLWIVGFVLALTAIGIIAAVPLYVFSFMRFRGGRALAESAFVAVGTGLFIWLLFVPLLRLDLYQGLLFANP